MNDLELSTAVQESFSGMNMTVPTDQIVRRSRVIRTRRRMYGMAGALALVAGVASSRVVYGSR